MDVLSFMLCEDTFFSIGCKESQRRSRAVGRRHAEDCCPALVRDRQRSLLPGGVRETTSTTRRVGSYADADLQKGSLRTHGARADVECASRAFRKFLIS